MDCPHCSEEICLKCKESSHSGKPCEYDEFCALAKDLAYRACVSCNYWIEKSEGCNHMTCICGAEFCYVCARD